MTELLRWPLLDRALFRPFDCDEADDAVSLGSARAKGRKMLAKSRVTAGRGKMCWMIMCCC